MPSECRQDDARDRHPAATEQVAADVTSQTQRLIVFAKLPKPGFAKTRLIGMLGNEGAAELHRQLAEHTLSQARTWQQGHSDRVLELQFTGGSQAEAQSNFAGALRYSPQVSGDLGEKMKAAFVAGFANDAHRIVVIGTDTPGLKPSHLTNAFQRLSDHDVVIGPSHDGGYYLLGLNSCHRALFECMPWSESHLFDQTVATAGRMGLSVALLDPLSDVDRPEDLPVWSRDGWPQEFADPSDVTSVIVPTLGETECLERCLASIERAATVEVIVVEGSSDKSSKEIAARHQAHWVQTPPGRGRQMNIGAALARGSHLVFLHSDTCLPPGFATMVRQGLEDRSAAVFAFRLEIDGDRRSTRRIAKWANRRARWLRMPYGDQALCVRRELFDQLNGYRDMAIMEDFDFIRRAKNCGRVVIGDRSVTTSARRWHRAGALRTTITNQMIVIGYSLGISPARLAKWYRRIDRPAHREKHLDRES